MCVIPAHGHMSTLNMFFFFFTGGFNIFTAARSYILNNNSKRENNQAWKYFLPGIVFANITSYVTAPPLSKGIHKKIKKKEEKKPQANGSEEVLACVCNLSGSYTKWICSLWTQRRALMLPQQLGGVRFTPLAFFVLLLKVPFHPWLWFLPPFYSQTPSKEKSGVKKKMRTLWFQGFRRPEFKDSEGGGHWW